MSRSTLLLLSAALLTGCASVEKTPRDPLEAGEWRSQKARMYHDLALQCLRAEDHDRARRLLQQAVQFDGKDPRTLELLARLAYVQGDLEAASGAARMLQELDPRSSAAWCTLGAVAEARNQPREAEDCYRRATTATPDEPRAFVDLHRLLLSTKRAEEAAAVLRHLQERFPQALEATLDHAATLAAAGSWSAATIAYGSALAARPDDPSATYGFAIGSVLSGEPAKALALGERLPPHARGDDPSLARAMLVAQLRAGNHQAALRELDLVFAQGPPSASLLVLRAEILAHAGLLEAAAAQFELAITEAPSTARAHAGLGRIHLARGRAHAAVRAFEQAVALRPGHTVDAALLAVALVRSGDPAAAVRHAAVARRDPAAAPIIVELLQQHPDLRDQFAEVR